MFSNLVALFLSSTAFAQEAAPVGNAAKPSMLETFMPFIFVLVIFYFLLIRPQGKRAKAHQDFLASLKRGDSVLTSGGLLGTIEGLTERFVTLQVADGVKIRVLRTQIAGPMEEEKKA
ncbi:MAG: preprotein translocase subunit YajC [Bdellovibrionales bacterium]